MYTLHNINHYYQLLIHIKELNQKCWKNDGKNFPKGRLKVSIKGCGLYDPFINTLIVIMFYCLLYFLWTVCYGLQVRLITFVEESWKISWFITQKYIIVDNCITNMYIFNYDHIVFTYICNISWIWILFMRYRAHKQY